MGNGGKIKIDYGIREEGRGHHLINPSTNKAKAIIFPAVSTLGKILLGSEEGCAWTHLIRASRTHQNSRTCVNVNRFLFYVLVCWIWLGLEANQILHTTDYVFKQPLDMWKDGRELEKLYTFWSVCSCARKGRDWSLPRYDIGRGVFINQTTLFSPM